MRFTIYIYLKTTGLNLVGVYIPTVQGCWDEDIVEGLNACECSYPSILAEKRGKKAHEWTNDQIHPEVREYLAQLPLSLREKLGLSQSELAERLDVQQPAIRI